MILHWSPRSPYVRKVMIMAHETGLTDRIQTVRSVAIRTKANPDILQDSPIGRIPVMVLDNGIVLSGSFAICDYLDSLHSGRKMIPASGLQKLQEIELHGIADGMIDTLIFWRGELMVPAEQCRQNISDTCNVKVEACLDWLEKKVDAFQQYEYGLGQITVGVALAYMEFRYAHIDWQSSRPLLTSWYQTFIQRQSSIATEVINDE